jgi:hypothetical protein
LLVWHGDAFDSAGRCIDEGLPAFALQGEGRRECRFVGLTVKERDCLRVAFGSCKEPSVRSCRVPRGEAYLGSAMKFLRRLSPGGVPTIRVAVLDAGDGGEDLPDVHDALGGVSDH